MRKIVANIATVATLSLALVPVLGAAQAANAAERQPSITVSFADLDLANPYQASIFKARVQSASETACTAAARNNTLQMTVVQCVVETKRNSERQLSAKHRQALTIASRATAVELAAK